MNRLDGVEHLHALASRQRFSEPERELRLRNAHAVPVERGRLERRAISCYCRDAIAQQRAGERTVNAVLAALQILSARNPRLYARLRCEIESRTVNTIRIDAAL